MTAVEIICGIYARISLDIEGEGLGVARQVKDCTAKANSLNWKIHDTYEDNDVSASKDVERENFDRLLADLEAGVINAIVVYDLDRLTRKPAELEAFIVMADKLDIKLANVSGDVDLTTANGRMIARIKGAVARQEAERIGERVKRQKRQRAEDGKPQGSRYRTYGFARDWTIVTDEMKVMVEAFKRRAKGESTTSIANDFKKRGFKTSTGKEWTSGILMSNLTNPIYAGLRRYNGEVIGKLSPEIVPHIKDLFPCVSEEVFELVQSEMVKDSKGTNARTHLGTGFLICKNCLTGMKGNAYTKNYRCSTTYGGCGRISIRMQQTDRTVIHMMMTQHLMKVAKEKKQNKPKPRDFAAEIAELDAAIAKLQEGYQADVYTLREVQPLLKVERDKKKAVQKAQAQELPERDSHNHIKTYMDFYKMSNSAKRVVISDYIENIVVHPRKEKGNHIFDYSRLEFHFKDGRIEVADGGDFEESDQVE